MFPASASVWDINNYPEPFSIALPGSLLMVHSILCHKHILLACDLCADACSLPAIMPEEKPLETSLAACSLSTWPYGSLSSSDLRS